MYYAPMPRIGISLESLPEADKPRILVYYCQVIFKEQNSLAKIPDPILVFESLFRALILLYWGSGLDGELWMLDQKVDSVVALKDSMIISPPFTPRLCCFF